MERPKIKLETLMKSGIFLTIAVLIFMYTRLMGLDNPYIKAFDPYYFYRVARTIFVKGFWPANDPLRYFPFGWKSQELAPAIPEAIVFFGKLSKSLLYGAHWYSFFFGLLSIIAMYLLANRFGFGGYASILLALMPAYLYRTTQGFADKEPFAFFLGITAWFFYVLYLEKRDIKYAILSGISLGAIATAWGGKVVFVSPIILTIGLFLLLDKYESLLGSGYTLLIYLFMNLLVPRYRDILHNPFDIVILVTAFVAIFAYLMHKYLKWNKTKILSSVFVVGIISLMIASNFACGSSFCAVDSILRQINLRTKSKGTTHYYTVAENQKPHWDWKLSRNQFFLNMGLGIFAIPAMLLLFFFKKKEEKDLFLYSIVAVLGISMTFAVRLLIFGALATTLASGYIVKELVDNKDVLVKAIGLLVAIAFLFYPAQFIFTQAKYYAATSMDTRWYQALKWTYFNIPQNEPIVTWWDYGYWIQTIANRTTLGDGANMEPGYKLNWYTGNFFATDNYENATAWLKDWNLTYVLIDNTMIGKFGAYSLLGRVKNPQGGIGNFINELRYGGKKFTDLGTVDVYTGYSDDLGYIALIITSDNKNIYPIIGRLTASGYAQFMYVPKEIAYITPNGALVCGPIGYCKAKKLGKYEEINQSVVIYDYGQQKIAYIGDTKAMHSTFARLWFFNGFLTDFDLLFNNGEVKIFKFNG